MFDFMSDYPWLVYVGVFFGPFIQEDAALIAAATLSLSGMPAEVAEAYIAIVLGLTASDLWKYWFGRYARTHKWAAKFADGPRMTRARGVLERRLATTLFSVRFIPGTRVPTYIAAGYFKIPFAPFALFIFLSASLLSAIMFILFHTLGAVIGEQVKYWLPVAAILALLLFGAYKYGRYRLSRRNQDDADALCEADSLDDETR